MREVYVAHLLYHAVNMYMIGPSPTPAILTLFGFWSLQAE